MAHICDDHLLRKILLKSFFVFRSMGHASSQGLNYQHYLLSPPKFARTFMALKDR